MELTLAAALIAGLVSFLSPCVLPVVPAYLGQLGVVVAHAPVAAPSAAFATAVAASPGGSLASVPAATTAPVPGWGVARGWRSLPSAIAFVLGFGSVFTVLGLFVYVAVGPLRDNLPLLRTVGGVLLIALGLNLMGVLRPARLMRTWRPLARLTGGGFGTSRRRRTGVLGGFLLGAVFAVGWSPCIGPTLGAILTMAAIGPGPEVGLLLVAYSAGLGIPFLALAIAVDKAPAITRPLVRHGRTIELIGGALVVVMGVAVLFDWLPFFAQQFSAWIPQV
jgi:cytochrome c-type biogenesis protein